MFFGIDHSRPVAALVVSLVVLAASLTASII